MFTAGTQASNFESKQVQQGCDDTQVQPTASHSMHKLHTSLICTPLKHKYFSNSTWLLPASGEFPQTSLLTSFPESHWNLCDYQRNQRKCNNRILSVSHSPAHEQLWWLCTKKGKLDGVSSLMKSFDVKSPRLISEVHGNL